MSNAESKHFFDLPKGAMNKMLCFVFGMTFAAAAAAAPEVTGVPGSPSATTTISNKPSIWLRFSLHHVIKASSCSSSCESNAAMLFAPT